MNKEQYAKLKLDPEKFKKHKEYTKKYVDLYKQKRKNDPAKHKEDLKYWKEKYWENPEIQRKRCLDRYRNKGKIKRKIHCFQTLSKSINDRHKNKNIAPIDLWSIAKKQKCICPITGDRLSINNISIDHIIPKVKGGKNEIGNIRLITYRANTAKNDMTDKELINFCEKVVNYNNRNK